MLKSRIDSRWTDRALAPISRLRISPNTWSLFALLAALAGFIALASHNLAAGLGLFVLAGSLDMVDGAVARASGLTTSAGAFMDGVLDRYVELLLILGLDIYVGDSMYMDIPAHVWILMLLFGSLMTSFVRAYADHRGLVKDPDRLKQMGGLLERAERLLLLYAGMLLGLYNTQLLYGSIVLVAILSNLTALQRIRSALAISD